MPVAGTFGPPAVRAVRSHGQGNRLERVPQHSAALGRLLVGHRQRPDRDAPVTDLVPVEPIHRPPALLLPDWKRLVDPLLHQRLADPGPILRRETLIQPVVADGKGMGHLGGVEEMRGIPVGKSRCRAQLPNRPLQVLLLPVQAVEQPQRVEPVQTAPALRQQPRPNQPILDGRRLFDPLRLRNQPLVAQRYLRNARNEGADPFYVAVQSDQPGMPLAQRLERILNALGVNKPYRGEKCEAEAEHSLPL